MIANPLVKATLQATILATCSNISAQLIGAHQKNSQYGLDILALSRFIVMTLITTPPNYKWQQFLEHTFPGYPLPSSNDILPMTEREAQADKKHKRRNSSEIVKREEEQENWTSEGMRGRKLSLRNTLTKWFIDCITVGAVLNTIAFLTIMGILKGYGIHEIQKSVQKETIPIILAGYKIWPIASIVSFSFIPVEKRIVFLSFVGFLWGIYMSLVAARV